MHPGTQIQLEALLREIAEQDREGDYVAPKKEKDRAKALGRLIAQLAGVEFAPFPSTERPPVSTWLIEYFSANPVQFVPAALNTIAKMGEALQTRKARRIDVAFKRCQDNLEHLFGDFCVLAICYTSVPDSPASVSPVSMEQKKRPFKGEREGWTRGK